MASVDLQSHAPGRQDLRGALATPKHQALTPNPPLTAPVMAEKCAVTIMGPLVMFLGTRRMI